MTDLIKSTLLDARSHFAVAFGGNKDVANKYILGVYNTVILNDKLMECDAASIRDAAITSAVLGVAVDARQYAYLVPYNKKAQFQMSYKGYVHVAKRDLDVDNIHSNIVYEDDTFAIDIGMNTLSHIPNLESLKYGKNESIKYVYAQVRFRTNTGRSMSFEVMTKAQIDEIRAFSKSGGIKDKWGNPTIWEKNYGEMARKTVIKRLCKHAQLGDTAALDEIDNGIEQGKIINVTPEGNLQVDNTLNENKNKILDLIAASTTQQEHEAIYTTHADIIEELTSNGMTTEISKASRDRKEELYINKVEECLEACEDLDSLERVFKTHEERINTFKASRRNDLIETYCGLKQSFIDAA